MVSVKDFIDKSVNQDIVDWNQWIDTYVWKKSDIYGKLKSLVLRIPPSETNSEIGSVAPYYLWVMMLKNPDIIIESANDYIKNNKLKCMQLIVGRRYHVILDDIVIAVIDAPDKKNYKYVGIPFRCMTILTNEYIEQFM